MYLTLGYSVDVFDSGDLMKTSPGTIDQLVFRNSFMLVHSKGLDSYNNNLFFLVLFSNEGRLTFCSKMTPNFEFENASGCLSEI